MKQNFYIYLLELMNAKQKVVVVAMLVLVAGLVLLPSWKGELFEEGYKNPETGKWIFPDRYAEYSRPNIPASYEKLVVATHSIKIHRVYPIFAGPNSRRSFDEQEGVTRVFRVNWKRVSVKCSITIVVGIVLMFLVKSKGDERANKHMDFTGKTPVD